MTATEQKTSHAIWYPGWYELDQTVVLGERRRFWFYMQPPADLPEDESYDFVFFNQVSHSANCQVREATVQKITHSQLGDLRKIDTDGLDYVFYLQSGQDLVVNAEENPGQVYDSPIHVDDWRISVDLVDVSEPITDFY